MESVKLYSGDCLSLLVSMPAESVHLVLTDPPYFLGQLDSHWSADKIERSKSRASAIGGLPVGMKFDPQQGHNLQKFLEPVMAQLFRVLMPGAFMLVFSAPRLAHRVAIAAEATDFEIRDQYAWRFHGKAQFKAFTQDHFIRKRSDMTETEKADAIRKLGGRRTPQLRPQFESIICAQKPREGTFVDNWLRYETGLIDAEQNLTGSVPETIMPVEKPTKASFNKHLTPKPVKLCEHLIRLFSMKGQVVLDPFVGSGSTCLAARSAGRASIGMDSNPDYINIAKQRLECD